MTLKGEGGGGDTRGRTRGSSRVLLVRRLGDERGASGPVHRAVIIGIILLCYKNEIDQRLSDLRRHSLALRNTSRGHPAHLKACWHQGERVCRV